MSSFFVDTSALAKRYVQEPGTNWVLTWIEPQFSNVTLVSELVLVEMQSLLARYVRSGHLSPQAAEALRIDFLLHYRDEYLAIPLDTHIVQSAGDLVRQHNLRSLDAIQLASAMHGTQILGERITFVSGDVNLLTAAEAEGFTTDNPYTHL